jgi:ribosomal protein L22
MISGALRLGCSRLASRAAVITATQPWFRVTSTFSTAPPQQTRVSPIPSPEQLATIGGEGSGRQLITFNGHRQPKLKPYIVARRLRRMRTYEGKQKGIRVSPWKLNLVCQFVAGMPLQEALIQLDFQKKGQAPLVKKVLKRTANLADIRDALQHSQLEVAECFATKGTHLKRIMYHSKGRFGIKERKFAHMRVVLREIDFKLKIYQAPTFNQKKRWAMLQYQAEIDGTKAQNERRALRRLEREAEKRAAARRAEKEEEEKSAKSTKK